MIHLYLSQRVVRDTLRPGRWRRAAGSALPAGAVSAPATLLAGGLSRRYGRWVAWPAFMGIMFYLLVALRAA